MAKAKKEEIKEVDVKEVINTDSIKEEVMAYVDSQIDYRLEKVVGEKVKKEIIDEIDKANRRVIHEKNCKILFKNIFLILFLGIIGLLVYVLYQEGYFDQYFNHSSKKSNEEIVEKPTNKDDKKEEEKGPTLEDYIQKYGSYLDSYHLNTNSSAVQSFYEGKLTDEVKNTLTIQTMDFDKFTVEDDYHVIDAEDILKTCNQLFEKCSKKSFDYNGEKIRYFQKLDSYVTNSLLIQNDSNVIRNIIDIQEDKNTVVITTVEGIEIDGMYYSVSPQEEVCEAYEGAFQDYRDSFNKVVYTFKNKKLVQVEKG